MSFLVSSAPLCMDSALNFYQKNFKLIYTLYSAVDRVQKIKQVSRRDLFTYIFIPTLLKMIFFPSCDTSIFDSLSWPFCLNSSLHLFYPYTSLFLFLFPSSSFSFIFLTFFYFSSFSLPLFHIFPPKLHQLIFSSLGWGGGGYPI